MSENEQEHETENDSTDDGDDLTPDDLKPGEDNPLAEPLDEDEASDDLDVLGGKMPEDEDDDDAAARGKDDSEEE